MSSIQTHNAYPNLPILPFKKTEVSMDEANVYLNSLQIVKTVKDSVYMIGRNESGNWQHGVNNNYIGAQADGSPLGGTLDAKVIATCLEPENGTGRIRRFCCFASYKDSIDILAVKVMSRGLYIGGHTHDAYSNMAINNIDDFITAYYQDYVTGDKNAKLPINSPYFTLFHSLYNDAQKLLH